MKIKVGILFGGPSREREVSFAGGRTVYDNLNKSIFDAVPLFIDSFGNLVLLDWQFIYKGSIRDFYPPVSYLKKSENNFQVYAESLGPLTKEQQIEMLNQIGKPIKWDDLYRQIDVAFLCLHGTFGEDGRVQGLLESLKIPYTGSGILPSAVGMNKAVQKEWMKPAGFKVPNFFGIRFEDWKLENKEQILNRVIDEVGFPLVVKPANQGSSIGVSVIRENDKQKFYDAINRAFFIQEINGKFWAGLNSKEKFVSEFADFRTGPGLPVFLEVGKRKEWIYHPEDLLDCLNKELKEDSAVANLRAEDAETVVLCEAFLEGKEFSCIVIENEGEVLSLPPTEIIKGGGFFDYRSKYLPGLSRKITPIELPEKAIQEIAAQCENLFRFFKFSVYARIDGFYGKDGSIFLNDPNTTSGMMPSSFFFHQAAEIGLNPSQFLTFILRNSLRSRKEDFKNLIGLKELNERLESQVQNQKEKKSGKERVGVILGGYSFERHISVESGRNVYEKLSSSEKYEPIPLFLAGEAGDYALYRIPINVLLKDNADDIREKIEKSQLKNGNIRHPFIQNLIENTAKIRTQFSAPESLGFPEMVSFDNLSKHIDLAFIALHGRPGEDGEIQAKLELAGIPYNGSGTESSSTTIDKFKTNELLSENGLLVPNHLLVSKSDWLEGSETVISKLEKSFRYPFVVKPVDDGCSAAVRIIKERNELKAFAEAIFRKDENLPEISNRLLGIEPEDEFPKKNFFLVEEMIQEEDSSRFLEITVGMLTKTNQNGKRSYEIFEPSEALSTGTVLSLEEKFLAGEGQNITPARFSGDISTQKRISEIVKTEIEKAARVLNIEGYARIDAFVQIFKDETVKVIFIEANSLPGMTPATCIFHQCALSGYKPLDFLDRILTEGQGRKIDKMLMK